MKFDVLTIFPEMIAPYLREGILGRATNRGILLVDVLNLREFAEDKHRSTDDRPYGGGNGMVMMPGPISKAFQAIGPPKGRSVSILLSPQGSPFNQAMAWELAELDQIILICGRYEGVDERIVDLFAEREISAGDYVLSGGELPALMVMDAVARLIPEVLGGERSTLEDTFEDGLLEYPQYTRPRAFMGREVPPVLLSGDHERIRLWRRTEAIRKTLERRPDLLEKASLTEEDREILAQLKRENTGNA